MAISDMVVLIPALNPDEKLLQLVRQLREEGFVRILVVDDGSSAECKDIFEELKSLECLLIHHSINLGKGAAIKTAIKAAIEKYEFVSGFITADADGQHLPKDIRHIAETMMNRPNTLVLGVRDFGSKSVPFRSILGNKVTSVLFRLTSGVSCPDTQTGLRGIPNDLFDLALYTEGDRYEYEMNFLMDAVRLTTVEYVTIETVYEDNNRTSHFRPIVDSCRVYGRFLRFAAASLLGAAVDFLLFYFLTLLLKFPQHQMIFTATGIARVGSGIVNFLLNKHWSFHSRMPTGMEMVRYFVLFVAQMTASAGLVSLIALSAVPPIAAKIIVDTVLFFISYRIQKNWVFRQEVKENAAQKKQ